MDLDLEKTSLILPPGVLWVALLLAVIIFIGLTITFFHHWKNYSFNENSSNLIKATHLVVSITLIVIMLITIFVYESGIA